MRTDPALRERICKLCQKREAAGRPLCGNCIPCFHLNPHLVSEDEYQRVLRQTTEPAKRKRDGMRYVGKNGLGKDMWRTRRGVSGLDPEQRKRYSAFLAKYLDNAVRKGKRIDGQHAKPYKLAALRWACHWIPFEQYVGEVWRKNNSLAAIWAGRRRFRFRRTLLAKVRRAKMLRAAGLDRKPEVVIPKPRSAYTELG